MKQLTCEMCGSTDLLKQDGIFVCQACGTKYSVEEAKKLMVEVNGTVEVKNAAQLENLLKLAHSSFESQNFAQAEAFCNQIIAMDDKNYDAWKLKGEAINYQITTTNQRILEVYNCIMTSYRVLPAELKKIKRDEILHTLKNCYEGEVTFWLKQFENCRPSDASFAKAKNAYLDAKAKLGAAFDELGLSAHKDEYLLNFSNYFIDKATTITVSTWKSTVGYNYYRDDFANLGRNWGRGNSWSNLVTEDTSQYRPTQEIAKTFISEGGQLINLLTFAESQFNKNTPCQSKLDVYSNIIYLHTRLADTVFYKIGSSAYSVGWLQVGAPTEEAFNLRNDEIRKYQEKIEQVKQEDAVKRKRSSATDCKGKSVDELLTFAYMHLSAAKTIEAEAIDAEVAFDAIIKALPKDKIGYIGKAVALAHDMLDTEIKPEIFIPVIESANRSVAPKYKKDVARLLNWSIGKSGNTLLIFACATANLDATKVLLELGADVHAKSNYNVTALWYIAHTSLPKDKLTEGREIARMLLDAGAEVDVTNVGGVALYNSETDYVIGDMIREHYPMQQQGSAAANASRSGGCYIATSVYGSYDCPQVWTLRRFRDYTLAETWYGKAFIRTYYAVSPTLVKWFGHTQWFKKMWKGKLDRMVANLNAEGIADTPYQDKTW